jgi:hypothetical protein
MRCNCDCYADSKKGPYAIHVGLTEKAADRKGMTGYKFQKKWRKRGRSLACGSTNVRRGFEWIVILSRLYLDPIEWCE